MEGLVFCVFFFTIIGTIIFTNKKANNEWKLHPTMEDYLNSNPVCKTDRGIKCSKGHGGVGP